MGSPPWYYSHCLLSLVRFSPKSVLFLIWYIDDLSVFLSANVSLNTQDHIRDISVVTTFNDIYILYCSRFIPYKIKMFKKYRCDHCSTVLCFLHFAFSLYSTVHCSGSEIKIYICILYCTCTLEGELSMCCTDQLVPNVLFRLHTLRIFLKSH